VGVGGSRCVEAGAGLSERTCVTLGSNPSFLLTKFQAKISCSL